MRLGYCRISTDKQDLAGQEDALHGAGCERLYRDQVSGVAPHRPGLEAALEHARKGDVLVVVRLDRLGRSVRELIDIVARLDRMGVDVVSLHESLDTSTPAGRLFFHICASMAEFERSLIVERTRAGLAAARGRGRHGGRPRRLSVEQVAAARTMIADGQSVAHVARVLGVAYSTAHDALRRPARVNSTAARTVGVTA